VCESERKGSVHGPRVVLAAYHPTGTALQLTGMCAEQRRQGFGLGPHYGARRRSLIQNPISARQPLFRPHLTVTLNQSSTWTIT
jgi:hypothetical protein